MNAFLMFEENDNSLLLFSKFCNLLSQAYKLCCSNNLWAHFC